MTTPRGPTRLGEVGAAIALFGWVLWNRPMIEVVDRGGTTTVGGWPLLVFYVFAVWVLIIGLLFLMTRRPRT
ncbi:MAG: hypothetical protein AAFX10_03390 [Pseudomonadota bacterium]